MRSLRKFVNKYSEIKEELWKNCTIDEDLVRSRFGIELFVLLKKLVMGLVSFTIFTNIKLECPSESLRFQDGNNLNSVEGLG